MVMKKHDDRKQKKKKEEVEEKELNQIDAKMIRASWAFTSRLSHTAAILRSLFVRCSFRGRVRFRLRFPRFDLHHRHYS